MNRFLTLVALLSVVGAGCANAPRRTPEQAPSVTLPPTSIATPSVAPERQLITHYESAEGYSFDVPQGSFVEPGGTDRGRIQNYEPVSDIGGLGLGQFYVEFWSEREPARRIRTVADCKTNRPGHSVTYGNGFTGWIGLGEIGGDAGGDRYQLCVVSVDRTIYLNVTSASGDGPSIANAIFRSFTPAKNVKANSSAVITKLDADAGWQNVPALSDADVQQIADDVSGSIIPRRSGWRSTWTRPSGVQRFQMNSSYELVPSRTLLFVMQPNTNYQLIEDGVVIFPNAIEYTGVLFTSDNGKTWRRVVTIPTMVDGTDLVSLNPVGLFAKNQRYYLDIADDRGAGSGEGNIIRFSTGDGRAWKKEGCYYLLPETYAEQPFGQKSIQCPTYAADLELALAM